MNGATPSHLTGGNFGDKPVMFRHSDAQRISNTVNAVENARRARNPSKLPRIHNGGSLTKAYFYGGWLSQAVKQITFAADTTSTAACKNLFSSVSPGTSYYPRVCFVTPDPDYGYVLVRSDC